MQARQQYVNQIGSYNYLLFLPPRNLAQDELLPTILFLHGSGERGSNLDSVKRHGVAKIVEQQPDLPFIVISPQCPSRKSWDVNLLNALLDSAIASYPIDLDRIYLTGLSMGGYGTWNWACADPQRFAAIAPVCGGGNPKDAHQLKNLPVWVFHGALDSVVPLKESEIMVSALQNFSDRVKFTVYLEANHDSWTETYSNPELYDWFLQHRRPS